MIIKPNTGHKVCSESQQRSLAVLTKYNTNVVNAAQGGGRDSEREREREEEREMKGNPATLTFIKRTDS